MKKLFLLCFVFAFSVCEGQSWDSLGFGTNGSINALTLYNNNIYAGGIFTIAGSIKASEVAVWSGTNWDSLESGIKINPFFHTSVYCLSEYNGNLFVGGEDFSNAGGVNVRGIAQWNGTSWDSVQGGLTNQGIAYALTTFNSELYAGGEFKYSPHSVTVNNIAKWNGVGWDSLGSGIN